MYFQSSNCKSIDPVRILFAFVAQNPNLALSQIIIVNKPLNHVCHAPGNFYWDCVLFACACGCQCGWGQKRSFPLPTLLRWVVGIEQIFWGIGGNHSKEGLGHWHVAICLVSSPGSFLETLNSLWQKDHRSFICSESSSGLSQPLLVTVS